MVSALEVLPRVVQGDEWMIRLLQVTLVAQPDAATDAVRSALVALDPEKPLEEQGEPGADGCLDVDGRDCRLRFWSDEPGLFWLVGVDDAPDGLRPSETDRWYAKREWLAWLIGELRVLIPLLDRRVRESGGRGLVELDGVQVEVARQDGHVEVRLALPEACTEAEVTRLVAIAAACVVPAPGWHLMHDDAGRPVGAVFERAAGEAE